MKKKNKKEEDEEEETRKRFDVTQCAPLIFLLLPSFYQGYYVQSFVYNVSIAVENSVSKIISTSFLR